MFRCAGVFLVLALLFCFSGVSAEPLDGYGIIQGVVTDTAGYPINLVVVSTEANDSLINDVTDSQGRYGLTVPLFDEDSLMVDVQAKRPRYIPVDSIGIVVVFLEIDTVDFVLEVEGGPIGGRIRDTDFGGPIESVYVSVVGDPTMFTYSNLAGNYSLRVFYPGEYNLSFAHPDFATVYRVVEVDEYLRLDVFMDRVIWYISTDGNDNIGRGGRHSPFLTIQTGIDWAEAGETVLVGPGIYTGDGNRDITIGGQQIAIRSEEGPEQTFIDCGGAPGIQHRAFTFNNVGSLTLLEGFTIENGYNTSGGGVHCFQLASPTIQNCIFRNNTGESYGGAIDVDQESDPIIRNCVMKYNTAVFGGAISLRNNSSPTIDSCMIRDNNASSGDGGGIFSDESFPLMRNCTLTRNSAGWDRDGGGIYCADDGGQAVEIRRCIIWDNEPDGIYNVNSNPLVEYSDVQGDAVWPGIGNINDHPLFCDYDDDDFSLAINSPCYDFPQEGEYIGALGMGCDSISVIYGWVTDVASLDSIPGVTVEAVCDLSPTETGTTDEDGYYELLIITGEVGTDTADVSFSHLSYRDSTVVDTQFTTGYSTRLDMEMEEGGCDYVPGDCDGDGNARQLTDVTSMISFYRGPPPPQYACECPGWGEYYPHADVDGNCVPFELTDVVISIAAYRGPEPLEGCGDCPGTDRLRPGGGDQLPVVPGIKTKRKMGSASQ